MLTQIILAFTHQVSELEIKSFYNQIKLENSAVSIIRISEECEENSTILKNLTTKAKSSILITDQGDFASQAESHDMACLAYIGNGNPNLSNVKYAITTLYDITFDFCHKVWQRKQGMPWEILETKRCKLREMTIDDTGELYIIYNEGDITKYIEPLYENPSDEIEYERKYIEHMYGFYGFGLWMIEDKETGEIIGRAGLSVRDECEDVELGYIVRKKWQHQGIAFEVCSAIMDYAKRELGLEQINAYILRENEVSIHLSQKLGFTYEKEVQLGNQNFEKFKYVK